MGCGKSMQIHVWQQFSSNHSAGFTVVGEFETPEAAEKAAEELRTIIRQIMAWHVKNPNAYDPDDQSLRPPSPPEVEVAEKYDVEWEFHVDWIKDASPYPPDSEWSGYDPTKMSEDEYYEQKLDSISKKPVRIFDKCIFINPWAETWSGHYPFAELVERLGGKSSYSAEYGGCESHFHLTLQVNSEEHGTQIQKAFVKEVDAYLAALRPLLKARTTTLEDWSKLEKHPFHLSALPSFEQQENTLKIKHIHFYASLEGFKVILDWLEKQGATLLEYETEAVYETPSASSGRFSGLSGVDFFKFVTRIRTTLRRWLSWIAGKQSPPPE